MSLEYKIKRLISEKLDVDFRKIVAESSFIDDLGADSIDIVELIMSLEEEFNIEISDEEVDSMVIVQDLIDYISAK